MPRCANLASRGSSRGEIWEMRITFNQQIALQRLRCPNEVLSQCVAA
jgi:hypothetical protein